MTDLSSSYTLVLANALAAKVGAIDGLNTQRRKIGPATRSMARVFPVRSSFADDQVSGGGMGTVAMLQGYAIGQWRSLEFEIALRVTDLNDSGVAIALEDQIVRQVNGFYPYYGYSQSSTAELTPFKIVGATRKRAYVVPSGEVIREQILTAQCQIHLHNGIPPALTPRPEEDLLLESAVDVVDSDAQWQVVAWE